MALVTLVDFAGAMRLSFGDSIEEMLPAETAATQHLYAQPGTYTLTVIDATGAMATTVFEAKAQPANPPDFILRADNLSVLAELTKADNVPVLVIWE